MRLKGCPNCAEVQRLPLETAGWVSSCLTCRSELERSIGRSATAALAFAMTALLLMIPASLAPFMTTSALGQSRQSILLSSVEAMVDDGWPLLAIVIALFVVVLPFLRFGLVTAVLGALKLGRRPEWLGPAFRYANTLQHWAMADVFLLGLAVAYSRLKAAIYVQLDVGAYCFIAVGLLTLFIRAALHKADIWRAISPDRVAGAGELVFSCSACDLLVPETMDGLACPRCRGVLHIRKPAALGRAAALNLAALVLYIPANVYPLATLPIGMTPTKYTVLQGVVDLVQARLYGLALLIVVASFLIPILKILGLGWCIISVFDKSTKHLIFKTRLYRLVAEIGRWSMVDPFVIACFVPVVRYNTQIYGRADSAAPAFTAVVILTLAAARAFDPRLMWDVARRQTMARRHA